MYIRGSRADYDAWARAGNPGWSYQDVLPYFLKSEDNQQATTMDAGFHGVGGYLTVTQFPYHPPLSHAILQAAMELGFPVSPRLGGKAHRAKTVIILPVLLGTIIFIKIKAISHKVTR